jgi:hypothetical protein
LTELWGDEPRKSPNSAIAGEGKISPYSAGSVDFGFFQRRHSDWE